MKRRMALVATAGAVAVPRMSAAAPLVIGWLSVNPRESALGSLAPVQTQLEARGWVVGRDIAFELRAAEWRSEQLEPLGRELLQLKPSLVVTSGGNAPVEALLKLTRGTPIVMFGSIAPAELGLVASLAHPGGNVTGATYAQREIAGKGVEVLHAASPRMRRMACVWNPDFPGMKLYRPYADPVARRLGLTISDVIVRRVDDFDLPTLEKTRPDALFVAVDAVTVALYGALIGFANSRALPSLGTNTSFARAGGLLSISYDANEMAVNVADCIDRILRGAKPGDIPVREPSRYAITLNRKTAAAMRLVPRAELMLAVNQEIE